ncbi:NUDIX domain-containing protein [Chishuiella sp.]|uniref:NUDIX hydrolase n=1 Tax=Chishuiella sp. TaxID=1969467 RepID=UPI0028A6AA62|nr:NUDIX domain-containing protein [Chishuiella sp.]
MNSLYTSGLLVLDHNKLLLTYSKNKKAWYLPGGKLDNNETSLEALVREIKEELSLELNSKELTFYTHISAPAYGEDNLQMEQDCFLYDLKTEIKPTNEIEAIKYFSFDEYKEEEIQVIGVLQVFEKLIKDSLI